MPPPATRSRDKMTFAVIKQLLGRYVEQLAFIASVNATLRERKIRQPNFPSEISENLVKFCIEKRTGMKCDWNVDCGDLRLLDKKIEVKGFVSDAPLSFGPSEKWDWIYFVDCRRYADNHFTVYELRANEREWHKLMVNKRETFGEQCGDKRRPRLKFQAIREAFGHACVKVFDSTLDMLN